MRFAHKFAGLFIAATIVASTAASAQSPQVKLPGWFGPGWTITPNEYRTNQKSTPRAPRPTAASPLTSGECRKLGGEVVIFLACKSGHVCTRKDEDGKTHRVCIKSS
jgi:hypothetical protein